MSEKTPVPPPEFVDVTPESGRRVRTETGERLPEGHVLRGVVRSTYWLRLERDRDVTLTPHQPAPVAEVPAGGPLAGDPPPGDPPSSDGGGGRRKS